MIKGEKLFWCFIKIRHKRLNKKLKIVWKNQPEKNNSVTFDSLTIKANKQKYKICIDKALAV